MALFARSSPPGGRTTPRSASAGARERPGRECGREEPRVVVDATPHVRERELRAGVPPAGDVDDLEAHDAGGRLEPVRPGDHGRLADELERGACVVREPSMPLAGVCRSEEHTSELQSPCNLVCRLL